MCISTSPQPHSSLHMLACACIVSLSLFPYHFVQNNFGYFCLHFMSIVTWPCHSAGHPTHATVELLLYTHLPSYLFVFVCLCPATYELIITLMHATQIQALKMWFFGILVRWSLWALAILHWETPLVHTNGALTNQNTGDYPVNTYVDSSICATWLWPHWHFVILSQIRTN